MGIRVPSQSTLDKYGLSLEEWQAIWDRQLHVCPICLKSPNTGTGVEFNIDHSHVRGWKNMPPQDRKIYVRGIVCNWCNRSYLAKGITLEKAKNMVVYLSK